MRRTLIAVPALLLAALAACSGSGDGGPDVATAGNTANASASADPSAPAADEDELQRQFTDCMRAEGVQVDDFKGERGGIAINADKNEVGEALQKCRKYLPNGGEPPTLSPEDIEKMREFAACMRANGVPDFPDPDPETGGFRANSSGKNNIQAAHEKCRDKMPQNPKGGVR